MQVRQGKTSPELDSGAGGSLVKQQIRQSVLSRHHRAQHQVDFYIMLSLKLSNGFLGLTLFFFQTNNLQPLDPMLAMAELSQMQVGRAPEEAQTKVSLDPCMEQSRIGLGLFYQTIKNSLKFPFLNPPSTCRCGIHPLKVGDVAGQNQFPGQGIKDFSS